MKILGIGSGPYAGKVGDNRVPGHMSSEGGELFHDLIHAFTGAVPVFFVFHLHGGRPYHQVAVNGEDHSSSFGMGIGRHAQISIAAS